MPDCTFKGNNIKRQGVQTQIYKAFLHKFSSLKFFNAVFLHFEGFKLQCFRKCIA